MSFKQNDSINLSNYEEYFLLYLDNELSAEDALAVESFVQQHPHLAPELDLLISTKLPLNSCTYLGKEELLAEAMKATTVDESLLLYLDNELADNEKIAVENKLASNSNYAFQFALLKQTKLDTGEAIMHPNKKELYRHGSKVVPFALWMRIAVALVIVLMSSLFFFTSKKVVSDNTNVVVNQQPKVTTKDTAPFIASGKQDNNSVVKAIVATTPAKKTNTVPATELTKKLSKDERNVTEETVAYAMERKVIAFDVKPFTTDAQLNEKALNKTIAHTPVTNLTDIRNTEEDALEPAVTDGDFKSTNKTPAKGFLRKVSRFIERNTGIGTVNNDNEILVGVLALKLK